MTEIAADHRAIRELVRSLEVATSEPTHRRSLMDRLTECVARHQAAEEKVLYPQLRSKLQDTDGQVDHRIAEHQGIEYVLQSLERLPADQRRFDVLLAELSARVRDHLNAEEELLPRLAEVFSPPELHDLGRRFQAARQPAPSRPHPSAPDSPPANLVVDPALAAVDRMRDAVRRREI
jgi:hemerythrin superfamily protein